ncbi:MAG: hypothetical protein WEA58_02695 [Balneolaceae bacterium]
MERRKQDTFKPEITALTFKENVQCLVFRTSLQNQKEVENISTVLDDLPGISDWYVDLEDWEKVLRIECKGLSADKIIKTLFIEGIIAEAMPTKEIKT